MIERAAEWCHDALDVFFRDDCHHTKLGAAFAASIIAEAFAIGMQGDGLCCDVQPSGGALPAPIDPLYWTSGRALRIGCEHLPGVDVEDASKVRLDVDPLTGERLAWCVAFVLTLRCVLLAMSSDSTNEQRMRRRGLYPETRSGGMRSRRVELFTELSLGSVAATGTC